jgi:ArsR family transcriptional regulator
MESGIESDIFKALAHPLRLKILRCLLDNKCECNVNKIVEKLRIPQSTVSQHLGVLRNKGIISPHKKGVITCYMITDERVMKILQIMN